MNGTRKPNAMLIELVIVILFFSISAGIILQLFVAANERSRDNGVSSAALFYAEDVAERLSASAAETDAYFEQAGWEADEAGYAYGFEVDGHALVMIARTESEETDAGTLDTVTLSVYDGEKLAVELPTARYLPKEGQP